jgi:hypothetical protein
MSARHRLSKLLLRQGIIYSAGKPWTGVHEVWLRSRRFDQPGLQMAFEIAYDTLLATVDRRDRLDDAIAAMAQVSGTTSSRACGCPATSRPGPRTARPGASCETWPSGWLTVRLPAARPDSVTAARACGTRNAAVACVFERAQCGNVRVPRRPPSP